MSKNVMCLNILVNSPFEMSLYPAIGVLRNFQCAKKCLTSVVGVDVYVAAQCEDRILPVEYKDLSRFPSQQVAIWREDFNSLHVMFLISVGFDSVSRRVDVLHVLVDNWFARICCCVLLCVYCVMWSEQCLQCVWRAEYVIMMCVGRKC